MRIENNLSLPEVEQPLSLHNQFKLGLEQFSQIINSNIPELPTHSGYLPSNPGFYFDKQNANGNGKLYVWPTDLIQKNNAIPRCVVLDVKYASNSHQHYFTESTIIWKSPHNYKYALKSKLNSQATFVHGFYQRTTQDNLRLEESIITDLSGNIYPNTFAQLNPQELNSINFSTFNQQHKNTFPQYMSWSETRAQFAKYWYIEPHL